MVLCCIVNCGMQSMRDHGVSFYRIPAVVGQNNRKYKTTYSAQNYRKSDHLSRSANEFIKLSEERQRAWISAIKRGELTDTQIKSFRVCSKHFHSGRPAELAERTNPDWAPCKNLGYEFGAALKKELAFKRHSRYVERMGKKKISQPSVPGLMKIEVKDEIGDNDVVVARDRLKGALREILHHSDEGSSADSSEDASQEYRSNFRKIDTMRPKMNFSSRKVKRRRQMPMDPAFHHTYVMKLFDRSVDLAQFREDTPLYPICRAWMANQPRNPNLIPKARSPSPEMDRGENPEESLYDSNGDLKEVCTLPRPLPSEEAFPKNRIPSPIPTEKEELNLDYDGQTLKSKEELWKQHKQHWSALRKKWHQQAHKNEARFAKSANILGTIFKKAQSEYE